MWAQWEIHVGPLTRAELSINNWACKCCCSGLHLPGAAKLLLTAAASPCQLSSQTDQLPKSIFIISNLSYSRSCPQSSLSSRVYFNNWRTMCMPQTGRNFSRLWGFTSSVWKLFQYFTTWARGVTQPWTVCNDITEMLVHSLEKPHITLVLQQPGWNVFIIPSVYLPRLKSALAAVWEWG